ncbi:Gfo/Idh/MocA family oxidoreductase [bacterium]|nr:Gfo/Idh/MocA family oxidoreductase [bacterium]
MKTVRIGMLGSGFVANFYMEGLQNVGGQEVVMNYSYQEDTVNRAEVFAKKWGIPEYTDNFSEAIDRDDIDLYFIAMPNEVHEEMAVKLAEKGKNQVCTKPLGRNEKESRAMVEAVEKAGVFHGYAETEVFAPAVVKAKDIIDKGGLGRVLWVRSREGHGGPHAPHFWDKELTGGGALMDLGGHCVEAARYFFGKDDAITEVFAWGDLIVHKDKTRAEDNALMMMRFESGGIAHIELTWCTRGGLDLRNEIHGTEGSIFTDVTRSTPIEAFTTQGMGYVIEKADSDKGWVYPLPEEAFTYGYQAECRHFVECVRDGKPARENYYDGLEVAKIIDAGYKSMEEKTWIKIKR